MHFFLHFYFIAFSNILLANSGKIESENSESSSNVQQNVGESSSIGHQNVGQIHDYQSQQPDSSPQFHFGENVQWEDDDDYLLNDPHLISTFLTSNAGSANFAPSHHHNPSSSSPSAPHSQNPFSDPNFHHFSRPFHFASGVGQKNSIAKPNPLTHHYYGDSIILEKKPFEAHSEENVDQYLNLENPTVIVGGKKRKYEEGISRKDREKIRRKELKGKVEFLEDFCAKCKQFPILEEMRNAHHQGLSRGNSEHFANKYTVKGKYIFTHRCILVMEYWLIKMEKELNEREKQMGKAVASSDSEPEISIEELILNAKQNQKILKKHALPFFDGTYGKRRKRMIDEEEMEAKKRRQNLGERQRRAELNEEQRNLFSTVPKEFIISQMKNCSKDTILEIVTKYVEFLFDKLEPHIKQIQKLAMSLEKNKQIDQNEIKMEHDGQGSEDEDNAKN